MFLWPGRRLGEAGGIRVLLGKVTGHVPNGAEVRQRILGRPEDDGIIPLFDENFRAPEAKRLRQANGLAASTLEYFRSLLIYRLYLFLFRLKRRELR